MIKQQLGEPIEGEYPDAFVEKYPELADKVKTTKSPAEAGHYVGSLKPSKTPRLI
jgi:hypothetical protein